MGKIKQKREGRGESSKNGSGVLVGVFVACFFFFLSEKEKKKNRKKERKKRRKGNRWEFGRTENEERKKELFVKRGLMADHNNNFWGGKNTCLSPPFFSLFLSFSFFSPSFLFPFFFLLSSNKQTIKQQTKDQRTSKHLSTHNTTTKTIQKPSKNILKVSPKSFFPHHPTPIPTQTPKTPTFLDTSQSEPSHTIPRDSRKQRSF